MHFLRTEAQLTFLRKAIIAQLSILLTAILWGVLVTAQTGRLTITSFKPDVSDAVMSEWKKDFFELDELWPLVDRRAFFKLLKANGLNEEIYKRLEARTKDSLNAAEAAMASTFYNTDQARAFLFVPPEIKSQIPQKILTAVYTHLLQNGKAPRVYSRFLNEGAANQFFEIYKLTGPDLNQVIDRLIPIGDAFYFFYTKESWPYLNDKLKTKLIQNFIAERNHRLGLQIDLTFSSSDDLKTLAERYAGERDPKTLERYLRLLLKQSPTGTVTIPLSDLLHPFIRKNINTYTACSGPNCFNSALSTNEHHSFEQKYVRSSSDLLDAAYRKYRFVQPNETLETGDLLIYRDHYGKIQHAATYIADGFVFTKNGLMKNNPYIFQTRAQTESIYFGDGGYKLMAFRIPKPGESVISPDGLISYRGDLIVYFDTMSEPALPVAPQAAKSCLGLFD